MSENAYSSPESELLKPTTEIATYTTPQLLFSFKGRIRRKTYWLTILGLTLAAMVLFFIVGFLSAMLGLSETILSVASIILYIPALWISLALAVKRWHDRNKSGWWVLISLIPIIGFIWALVENGFLQGDLESNNYGFPNK